MKETDHEYTCPLSAVDRRLDDVHRHWHDAERSYFHPERFRIAIQTAIQTLRTVTFIVQSNKRLFPNFDTWYDAWQKKLRADPLMRWMVDARNKIEKQGDLEAHSRIRAEIVASYFENGPNIDVDAELFQDTADLIGAIKNDQLKKHVLKDGILRVQRRWVENTLPEYDLLEAVGIAYGRIAELVEDAHRELGLSLPKTMDGDADRTLGKESRGGRLPCMIGHGDVRSLDIWIATGQPFQIEQKKMTFDRKDLEAAVTGYKIDSKQKLSSVSTGPEGTLHTIFGVATKMFEKDGYHETIAFFLSGERVANLTQLKLEEHGEKYLVMRTIANEVIKIGADGVILIGEVWRTTYDPKAPFRRAADAPDRREYLSATLITKTGVPVRLIAPIVRKGKTSSIGKVEVWRDQAEMIFIPIYAVWGKEVPRSWGQAHMGARDSAEPTG